MFNGNGLNVDGILSFHSVLTYPGSTLGNKKLMFMGGTYNDKRQTISGIWVEILDDDLTILTHNNMATLNISKRSIFKRRRDGQVTQGGDGSVTARSVASPSSSEFNPVILQDYAKKVGGNLFKGDQNFEDNINVAKKLTVATLAIGGSDFDPSNIARTNIDNQMVGQTINGHLVVKGDITQSGQAYTTHAQHVEVENNLMQLNKGETAAQITGVIPGTTIAFSGIENQPRQCRSLLHGRSGGSSPLNQNWVRRITWSPLLAREDAPLNNGVMLWDSANHRLKAVAAAPDADKLGGILASKYARTDIDETFSARVWLGGTIYSSSVAKLQVNGFMRTGNIYLHTGGEAPSMARPSDALSNNNGSLEWRNNTVLDRFK